MSLQARALVSSRWLAQALQTQAQTQALKAPEKLCVLDSSWFMPKVCRDARSEFEKKHIPGASFFDIDQCCDKTSPLDHMLPSEQLFADYVGQLGIHRDTHVVVYDVSEFGAFSSPRVWWMFRVFGHQAVSVLDGGLRCWELHGIPVTDKYTRPAPTEYKASLNRSWIKSYQDILDNLETKKFQVVDTRPLGRFRGLEPEPRGNTDPGHIPGSISIPFHSFLSPSGHFLRQEQLQEQFSRAGVDLSRPVCVVCGSAVTACHVVLAGHECGHTGMSVYDGGWSEKFTRVDE
ncbi:3-mercaptopyruvate sulfurtransferase-like [Gouania willdenowi]|uniref:3-mercaptopyruvate sulfurtransferase-like n=1 Tax=Gouania willdenowi TaxID=441366 RepID=A0A8C5D1Z5_GOUWI|nr:3-mercaptopyruvate sulfurtransferase-like [Gouania willdenowi]